MELVRQWVCSVNITSDFLLTRKICGWGRGPAELARRHRAGPKRPRRHRQIAPAKASRRRRQIAPAKASRRRRQIAPAKASRRRRQIAPAKASRQHEQSWSTSHPWTVTRQLKSATIEHPLLPCLIHFRKQRNKLAACTSTLSNQSIIMMSSSSRPRSRSSSPSLGPWPIPESSRFWGASSELC